MTKITQLDALTTQAAGDLIAIVDDVGGSPETKKITITNLFQGIPVDVGIGTDAPSAALHIETADAHVARFIRPANAPSIIIGSSELVGANVGYTSPHARFGHTSSPTAIMVNAAGEVGVGIAPKTLFTLEGTLTLKEQAAADGDTAAYGQLWVKTADPCELWFTDDAGLDTQIV